MLPVVYQTSKGYISTECSVYRTGGAFEVWLKYEICYNYYVYAWVNHESMIQVT